MLCAAFADFLCFSLDTDTKLCYIDVIKKGGGPVETGKRIQVTLAQNILDKLDALCAEKGMKRSAVLSLALDKYWKEEKADG